ncbi:MAG: dihydrolipoyl dehydrogenase [Candidatus Hatepunaea meridiana]|nr:dihydrolipoyl dehydrogenase [Candidatus Hatepunaea meridiana]
MDKYNYAIIGAGPGGYISAIRAAQLGLKTVLIEKDDRLGGTCLNVGCIPSKALLESSEWFTAAKHKFNDHGIIIHGVELDLRAMMARKEWIVKTLTDGIAVLMKKNKVTVVNGMGRLTAPGLIAVEHNGQSIEIEADAIILATGSIPIELPFMPFDGKYIVNSTDALSFDFVPEHLIVVGAGAIGLELGSVWNRLGAKVSIVEMLPQVAPFADKQMAIMLQRSLKSQGMDFYLKSKVTGSEVKNGKVILTYEDAKGEAHTLEGNKILVAVGRKPNSANVGLKEAGVMIEKSGIIPVDSKYRTNVKGIYAIGDLIQGPMLAHKAEEEGIAVAEIVEGKGGYVNYDIIPNVIYTSPELAVTGISEEEAKRRNIKYKTGKFYFRGNGRALSLGETDGLVKVLTDAETGKLLGVHILGPRASDLIAEAVLALEVEATAEDIGRMVHAHPTLSEAIKEAALGADGRQIHS